MYTVAFYAFLTKYLIDNVLKLDIALVVDSIKYTIQLLN